jgi:hypothetical protein
LAYVPDVYTGDDMHDSDEREIRAARNQALFRAVNEKIAVLNEALGELAGTFSVTCECADNHCITLLEIAPDDYRDVRKSPRTFVVLPEHVQADVENVVSERDGYVVVEVIGRGVVVAEATFRADEPSAAEHGGD